MTRPWGALRRAHAEDPLLFWILVAFGCVQLIVASWDLPSSFTWEVDALAPRIAFTCLRENLTPHQGCQYPLVQSLIIALLSLPALVYAALTAPAFTPAAIEARMMDLGPMTAVSAIGKAASIAMMSIALVALARIARKTFDQTAARCAVLFAIVNVTASYYGRTSNTDGPYMMWTLLALNRAIPDGAPLGRRDYAWFGVFAALALATKDQAYAAFVATAPLYLLALPLRDGVARGTVARHCATAAVAALAVYLLFAPVVLNPSGWLHRVEVMTGRGSVDYRLYPPGLSGLLANVRDLWTAQGDYFWPWPVVIVAWAGVLVAARWPEGGGARRPAYRMLMLVAGLSAIATFTLVAARSEHRFVLPMAFVLAYYAGVAVAAALRAASLRAESRADESPWLRNGVVCAAAGLWLAGAASSSALMATQLFDARHLVEARLEALPAGSIVETYGRGTILPVFDVEPNAPYRVRRVEATRPARRAKLPGVEELQGEFGARFTPEPDAIVVTDSLWDLSACGPARRCNPPEPVPYFRRAAAGELPGYERPEVFRVQFPAWLEQLGLHPVSMHASTNHRLYLLRRSVGGR